MNMLLRLPIILLEMLLRGGVGAVRDVLRRVSDAEPDDGAATAEAVAPAVGARREAERVAAEEAAARRPAARPSAARRRTRPSPAPEAVPPAAEAVPPAAEVGPPAAEAGPPAPEAGPPAAEPAHISTDATPVASFGPSDDPGATIEVEAPWPNYDAHPAAEVMRRVRAGDEATRAVVLLYERGHKGRKSVIDAAEGR